MAKIVLVKRYTKSLVRNNPNFYFVFGDNFVKKGYGGQAIIRDLENTIGVPTKKYPSNDEKSFMTDEEFEINKEKIDKSFFKIRRKLKEDNYIVLPRDGLGTGLAKLDTKAPKTFEYLTKKIEKLKKDYGVVNHQY